MPFTTCNILPPRRNLNNNPNANTARPMPALHPPLLLVILICPSCTSTMNVSVLTVPSGAVAVIVTVYVTGAGTAPVLPCRLRCRRQVATVLYL